jgi:NAD(P)-dependent dehydrogenase (short-subunit alcohol dehydrogenase family)
MDTLLNGRAAVVTGGASGIGRSIARSFAHHGADVVIADVTRTPREGGEPVHESIQSETSSNARFVECDVSNVGDLQEAVDAAAPFGGIDAMVNNAGIHGRHDLLEVTEEEYDMMMDINARGAFFGTKLAAKRMVERTSGTIINVSSTAAFQGSSLSPVYSMSKAAIRLLTYSAAGQLGPRGVRVNAIHPGLIETALSTEDVSDAGEDEWAEHTAEIPTGRIGQPEDIANCALFLASDLSEHVNGGSLVVDGGTLNYLG